MNRIEKLKLFREMQESELLGKLEELRNFLHQARYRHAVEPIENTAKMRATRKDIARILTILNERD